MKKILLIILLALCSFNIEAQNRPSVVYHTAGKSYDTNALVSVDGVIYKALSQTSDTPPNVNWEEVGSSEEITASTGLEAIDEGNGLGYRLVGADASKLSNIGLGAIDFTSTSGYTGTDFGVGSLNGFSVGTGNKLLPTASNFGSHVAFGGENEVSGYYNLMAFGSGNIMTQGYSAAAIGYGHTVNLNNVVGQGFTSGTANTLNGYWSSAIGSGLISKWKGGLVVGEGNVDSSESVTATDRPLFVVGNGEVSANSGNYGQTTSRSDAFRVRKNGELEALSYGEGTFTGTPTYDLQVDADGNIIETAISSTGGGLQNIVEDTTPQLGGNLDLNSFNISTSSWWRSTVGSGYDFTIKDTNLDGNNLLSVKQFDLTTNGVIGRIGDQDDVRGQLILSNGATTYGGVLRLDNAPSEDTNTPYWFVEADGNFKIFNYLTSAFEIDDVTSGLVAPETSISDITTLGNKALITKEYGDANYLSGGLQNIVEDTMPQLGGDLDAQGNTISGVSSFTANSIIKSGATSDDVLLGDGTTASLAGLAAETILSQSSTITTSRTALLTDANGMNVSTSAADIVMTIPENASVAFEIGTILSYQRQALGDIIIAYSGAASGDITQTYTLGKVLSLWKTGTDTWKVFNPDQEHESFTSAFYNQTTEPTITGTLLPDTASFVSDVPMMACQMIINGTLRYWWVKL